MIEDIAIIDVDTHVVEPPDLWTARLSAKWGDRLPHVEWDANVQKQAWFMEGQRLTGLGAAMADFDGYPPDYPASWDEIPPALTDPTARLARMDQYGIQAQLLYPNIAMFNSSRLRTLADAELQLDMVRAYNDWQTEWSSTAPDRFYPITILPFWDIDATLAEIERCAAKGHRGINFTQNPQYFDLPTLDDRHWDPMWASAQEKRLVVNFHIASGVDTGLLSNIGSAESGRHANYGAAGVVLFTGNVRTIVQLAFGGVCHRFPRLDFVSVESGIGWLPFTLEAMDWQWKGSGVVVDHPEYDLLPSEYFQRQIYGCFWFEDKTALAAIEALGPDNFLYETDFPHPTSMSPGPASPALAPNLYVEQTFGHLPETTLRKLLHDNAARIYGIA
jgi:predicted TIM-barrel fold metal-dependent hydrolase